MSLRGHVFFAKNFAAFLTYFEKILKTFLKCHKKYIDNIMTR